MGRPTKYKHLSPSSFPSQVESTMPVISNLNFSTLSAKISEYSRLEQIGAVLVGLVGVYFVHAVRTITADGIGKAGY